MRRNNQTKHEPKKMTFRETLSLMLNMFLREWDDNVIDRALSVVLAFFEADRISLRLFKPNSIEVYFTSKAIREGIPETKFSLPELLLKKDYDYHNELAKLVSIIKLGREIVVDDINHVPDELAFAQEMVSYNDTKSCLLLPTFNKDQVNGYIVIDYVTKYYEWKADDIENLKVISELLSNAIDHERANKAIEVSELKSLKNEVLLDMVFNKLPIGVELYDEKGNLTRVNRADLDILGTTEDKLLGVNLFDNPVISAEDKARIRRGEEAIYENDYHFDEIKDNSYYDNNNSGIMKRLLGKCIPMKDNQQNVFGYLTIVIDNTNDYQRKRELEYNLTKLRMAMDTGHALMWEYDVASDQLSFDENLQGDITSWDFTQAGQSDMFTSQGQMEGVHPEDADRFFNQTVMPILNGDIRQATVSYRQYMKGKLEWLTSNFRGYYLEGSDKPSKVFCYTMVVTEQREMELELIKIKETDRLKTLFMENLSHEIRTPLNAIVGFSNIIAETNHNEENEEMVNQVNENNEVLLNIVDNMIDLSKIEIGGIDYEYGDFDLKDICHELHDKYDKKIAKGIVLELAPALPSLPIYSDEKRIRQVISLLLDNAIKFTEQGNVSLSYESVDSETVRVSVKDTGIGLSEEECKHLFDPFYKVDTFRKGTGLGLHISKRIVTNLGGAIGVSSQKGEGSTFWFTIPVRVE